jgi:hypothetical protein
VTPEQFRARLDRFGGRMQATKVELKAIINERLQEAKLCCPPGFTVTVFRSERDAQGDWRIHCESPDEIAGADCCFRACYIADELRQRYSLMSDYESTPQD